MIFSILLSLLFIHPVGAYDQRSTHPALTYEMALFFNAKNLNPNYNLSSSEINWLKQGAVEEDGPARWINHFYDPVHDVGWSGKHLGNLSEQEGYQLGGDIAPKHALPSIKWVTNQEYQSAYGRQYGNQTWQRALRSYIEGDTKTAFIALGHVLHLVEDVSVPDHVRDDSHPGIEGDPGSPYEAYSKVQTDEGALRVAKDLLQNNANFKRINSVSQAIKDLAIYTNKNFFSEDTINNTEFNFPALSLLKVNYIKTSKGELKILFDSDNKINLAKANPQDSVFNRKEIYSINETDFVLPSYRDKLFPEAVLTGASVINLFFQEVEKYKQNPDALEPIISDSNTSFLVALQQFPKRSVIKICSYSESTCKDMHNTIVAATSGIAEGQKSLGSSLLGFFNGVLDSVKVGLGLQNQITVENPVGQNFNQPAQLPAASPISNVEIAKISQVNSNVQNKLIKKVDIQTSIPVEASVLGVKIINPVFEPAPSQAVYGGGIQGANKQAYEEPMVSYPILTLEGSVEVVEPTSSAAAPSSTIVQEVNSNNPASATSSQEVVPGIEAPTVPILGITNQSGLDSVSILVHVTSSDTSSLAIYFEVEFSTNSMQWQSIATSTVNTVFTFSGARGQSYYFRARAIDISGNTSAWSEPSLPNLIQWSREVVINEIAWSGTSADYSTHEWFELYNNTDHAIDLKDWKLIISNKVLNWSKVNSTIVPARSFYLFERTTDNTIKEIAADAIFTGSLSNSGEKLEIIKPNGEVADEVNASAGWFAGDAVKYKTMERINPLGNGSDAQNWQSNQGFRENGRTFNGGQIYGSPKRSNFGFINLNFDQEDSVRVLTKNNSPYILQYYSIPVGKKLIIEPGVIIKSYFNNSKIDILGNLTVSGSADEKVIFTSGRDVSFEELGSRTVVGPWSAASSSAQDWQGFWFKPGSVGTLNNMVLRYAGKGFVVPPFAIPVSQAIRADNSILSISNSSFSNNGPLTFFEKDSTTTITHTVFAGGDRAIQSENSSLIISDSEFNYFSNNNGPLYIKDRWPALTGITYANNILNMPYLENVTVANQEVVIGESQNYLLNTLSVSSSARLTIEPGVSIFVPLYGIIEVRGSLNVFGTAQKPVNFLPYPETASWGNLRFYNSTSTLNFVHFKQGNRLNGRPENLNGMILVNDSNVTITNSNLWDSEASSVQSNNSILTVSNTTIGASIKNANSRGVKTSSGAISLDAVNFNNLAIGVESNPSNVSQLVVDFKNMSSSSFVNVDYFWQPLSLWSVPPPLP
ncbi:MAG: lamin tail domain-containing protein [Candidatus Magasanikbacteria bacterium]|nr:lamin tail domain-containing protein [Candidatus Magasanikbacteria bacterium]